MTEPALRARRGRVRSSSAGTARYALLLVLTGAITVLSYTGHIDSQATVALLGLIVGGVVHASGTQQGSQASATPPTE